MLTTTDVFLSWLYLRYEDFAESSNELVDSTELIEELLSAVMFDLYSDSKLDDIFLKFKLREKLYISYKKLVDCVIEFRRENGLVDAKDETPNLTKSFKAWLYQQRHFDISSDKLRIFFTNDVLIDAMLQSTKSQLQDDDYLDMLLAEFRYSGRYFYHLQQFSEIIIHFNKMVLNKSGGDTEEEIAVAVEESIPVVISNDLPLEHQIHFRYASSHEIDSDKSLSKEEKTHLKNELNLVNFKRLREYREANRHEEAKEVADMIFHDNLKLVHDVINKLGLRNRMQYVDEMSDYVNTGSIGLINAIREYNYELTKFSTFAVTCIKNSLRAYINAHNSPIKFPTKLKQLHMPCHSIKNKLLEMKGQEPTDEEIAEFYNETNKDRAPITSEHVREALAINLNLASIDQPVNDEDDSLLRELVIDQNSPNPVNDYEKKALRDALDKALMNLTAEEEYIITLYYGFQDGIEKKPKEIAEIIGKSPERIRQIIKKAIATLGNYSNSKQLIPFMYPDDLIF